MSESSVWGSSRPATLLLVLAAHLVLILLLVMASQGSGLPPPASLPIELIYLPETPAPSIRLASARPPHSSAHLSVSPPAPELDPSSSSTSAGSAADTGGSSVNWAAEARRAVQAYEIRRDQHVSHAMVGSTPWDGWLPRREHRAGDRARTESGDWIVWIDANCYQVASWHAGAPAQDATQSPTICAGSEKKPSPQQ